MSHALKLLLPILLFASPAPAQEAELPAETGPVTRQTAVRDSPLLDFEYSWPQAIAPEARLVATLSADLSASYEEAMKNARENKTDMDKAAAPFNQNSFARIWTLEGETPRLISLLANTDAYAGGAHPNHDSTALLWDRTAARELKLAELFAASNGLETVTRSAFCKLLDAERLKRRQGETLEGEFSQCPAYSELTIAPAARDEKRPFDSIKLIADPYVAGPYVEGDYEITVPVTAALIEALRPEYRADFQVQPAQ